MLLAVVDKHRWAVEIFLITSLQRNNHLKFMDYKIIAFDSSADVETAVKKALGEGWKPVGGVSMAMAIMVDPTQPIQPFQPLQVIKNYTFAQAMIKGWIVDCTFLRINFPYIETFALDYFHYITIVAVAKVK